MAWHDPIGIKLPPESTRGLLYCLVPRFTSHTARTARENNLHAQLKSDIIEHDRRNGKRVYDTKQVTMSVMM